MELILQAGTWIRRVTTGTFTGFHHPSGDVKKVSTTNTIDAGSVYGEPGTHWHYFLARVAWKKGRQAVAYSTRAGI